MKKFNVIWGACMLGIIIIATLAFRYSSFQEKQTFNKLVWQDEFDQDGLPDSNKWSYDYGSGCERGSGCGWGNNELQFYTKERLENARVEDGKLIIQAHKEDWKRWKYTSARLVSKHKGDWQYGRVEVRAKLPKGKGTWAAIWMLPSENQHGGWPRSGEIDIMEFVGYEADSVYSTVHTEAFNHLKGTQRGGQLFDESYSEAFHTYALDWHENKMIFTIDEKPCFVFENTKNGVSEWPFNQPFHLLLNLAVGGNWGGAQGVDPDIWPQQMEIDYVRVYQ